MCSSTSWLNQVLQLISRSLRERLAPLPPALPLPLWCALQTRRCLCWGRGGAGAGLTAQGQALAAWHAGQELRVLTPAHATGLHLPIAGLPRA